MHIYNRERIARGGGKTITPNFLKIILRCSAVRKLRQRTRSEFVYVKICEILYELYTIRKDEKF